MSQWLQVAAVVRVDSLRFNSISAEESIEKYKSVFEKAQKLGVKYFTFHGDRIYASGSDELTDIAELEAIVDALQVKTLILCSSCMGYEGLGLFVFFNAVEY